MSLSHASIGADNLTADPRTRATAQPDNRLCDLLGLPDAPHGAESRDRLQHLLRLALVEELRARGTWGHGVDGDALGRQLLAHDAGHLLDGTFGGIVE